MPIGRGRGSGGGAAGADGNGIAVYDGSGAPGAIAYTSFLLFAGDPFDQGGYKIRFKSVDSATIAWDATFDEIITAMEAMSTVGVGNIRYHATVGHPTAITGDLTLNDQTFVGQFIGALAVGDQDIAGNLSIVSDTTLSPIDVAPEDSGSNSFAVVIEAGDHYVDTGSSVVYIFDGVDTGPEPGTWIALNGPNGVTGATIDIQSTVGNVTILSKQDMDIETLDGGSSTFVSDLDMTIETVTGNMLLKTLADGDISLEPFDKLKFHGAAGLTAAARPALTTQAVTVSVAFANDVRAALIALGVATDGD